MASVTTAYGRTVQHPSGNRPRASLGRVLDDLGATLLDLAHGDPEHAGELGAW